MADRDDPDVEALAQIGRHKRDHRVFLPDEQEIT